MSCVTLINGIQSDCASSLGGVRAVYIANYDDVQSIKEQDGQIVNITMKDDKKFFKFEFKRNTANMTSTLNVNAEGSNSVTTDVVMRFNKQETQKRLTISALVMAETMVIVRDANNLYWMLGKDFPVAASAATAETGTAFTDSNNYNITLQDNALDFPMEISTAPAETEGEYVDIESIVDKL